MEDLITKLQAGAELDAGDIESAAKSLLDETVDAELRKGFLRALTAKGETSEEIAGFAQEFLRRAVDPGLQATDVDAPLLDVCGTGGDKLDLFNVSTTSTFLLAAAGIAVVKHGNRGITSKSGGADVLEALGIRIDLPPAEFRETVKRTGMGFLFAPMYHPAFKAVAPLRKELAEEGCRTIFNILGPLLNPVRPDYQVVGVFDAALPSVFARILRSMGRKRAWAVCGQTEDGRSMDELSTLGPSWIAETKEGEILQPKQLQPSTLGLQSASLADLQGGDARVNAVILTDILEGKDQGPRRDLVSLNAAAGLVVTGVERDLSAGMERVSELIASGKAIEQLRKAQAAS